MNLLHSQHTFSIVAIDTVSGEVGGAGATCYATVIDIADVHPGLGFIHTQSYVDYSNQSYARKLMDAGCTLPQIMDSLKQHDAGKTPWLRQYAAVSSKGDIKAIAFSGDSCFSYYGTRVGKNYAIAGNILKGPEVLDSMEARFIRSKGTLAQRLMEALQGAKMTGADKRCMNEGVSSLSAYLLVAKPGDKKGKYHIRLNVEKVLPSDPIDVLQAKFNRLISERKKK